MRNFSMALQLMIVWGEWLAPLVQWYRSLKWIEQFTKRTFVSIFLKMVRSIQLLMEKPGGVVCSLYALLPFFLSYTSTRIHVIRIFRTSRRWWKLGWHKQFRTGVRLLTNWREAPVISFLGGLPGRRGERSGQLLEKTGRDRWTPSTTVQPQDGRTAPLRTLHIFQTMRETGITRVPNGPETLHWSASGSLLSAARYHDGHHWPRWRALLGYTLLWGSVPSHPFVLSSG